MDLSLNENDKVKNKSDKAIESLAEYNLDIIYGGDKNPSYGVFAQDKIINILYSCDSGDRSKYYTSIIKICRLLLSPSATGTSSTYNQITWKNASIPVDDGIKNIRG